MSSSSSQACEISQPKWHVPNPAIEGSELKVFNSLTRSKVMFKRILGTGF